MTLGLVSTAGILACQSLKCISSQSIQLVTQLVPSSGNTTPRLLYISCSASGQSASFSRNPKYSRLSSLVCSTSIVPSDD